MARKVWVAILGFGLLLFVLVDVALAWSAATHYFKNAVWGLLVFLFLTWDVYIALRKRIDSKPGGRAM